MAPVAVKFRYAMSLVWTSCLIAGTVQGEERSYVVLPGESLSKILHKHGISVEDLYRGGHWLERNKRRNKIVKDWLLLQPGTRLSLELPDYLSVKPSLPSIEKADLEDLSQASGPRAESSMPFDHVEESPQGYARKEAPDEPTQYPLPKSAPRISASAFVEQSILMQKSASRAGARLRGLLPLTIDLGLENSSPLILNSNLGDIRILWRKVSIGFSHPLTFDSFQALLSGGVFAEASSVSIPLQNSLRQTTRKKISSSGTGHFLEASLSQTVLARSLGLRVNWEQTPNNRAVSFSRANVQANISLWSSGPWQLDAFGRYTQVTLRSEHLQTFQNVSMKSRLSIPAMGLGLSYEP